MTNEPHIGRRALLAGAAALATAAWAAPAPASAAVDAAADEDPDELFRLGRFAAADRAYAAAGPGDAHAVAQRGYIALLENRLGAAERLLRPEDNLGRHRLAEVYARQDRHDRAVPLLRATGDPRDAAVAEQYARLGPAPYEVRGARRTRVPLLGVDPLPHVEVALNGGRPRRLLIDTYATLTLTPATAAELGLRAVASTDGVADNRPVTMYLGVLDSLRIGGIELRSLPVQWIDLPMPDLPGGGRPDGVFGTSVLYHLLSTLDYARGSLELRRPGPFTPTGNDLPMWLAGDHFVCTLGSLGDSGPRIVTLDTGGIGHGLETTVEIAERAGIAVDYAHPDQVNGVPVYPIRPDRIALGRAVGRGVGGIAVSSVWPGLPGPGLSRVLGFDAIANFTHEYLRPFALTFDYTAMRLSVTRPAASR